MSSGQTSVKYDEFRHQHSFSIHTLICFISYFLIFIWMSFISTILHNWIYHPIVSIFIYYTCRLHVQPCISQMTLLRPVPPKLIFHILLVIINISENLKCLVKTYIIYKVELFILNKGKTTFDSSKCLRYIEPGLVSWSLIWDLNF